MLTKIARTKGICKINNLIFIKSLNAFTTTKNLSPNCIKFFSIVEVDHNSFKTTANKITDILRQPPKILTTESTDITKSQNLYMDVPNPNKLCG